MLRTKSLDWSIVMKSSDQKRKEAEERNSAWAEKSPEEQLAHLDKLKLRAKRQRDKIQTAIKKST